MAEKAGFGRRNDRWYHGILYIASKATRILFFSYLIHNPLVDFKDNSSVCFVVGSRAEIIKLSELIRAYRNDQNVCVLYTGEHYSHEMKDEFFDELGVAVHHDLQCRTSDTSFLTTRIS